MSASTWHAVAGLAIVSAVTAQAVYDVCAWSQTRAGVVRGAWYFEGGQQQVGTWTDSQWSDTKLNSSAITGGLLYKFNFSQAFDYTQNTVKDSLIKIPESLTNAAPYYTGGAMFADYDEFYTYGGVSSSTNPSSLFEGFVWDGLYQPNEMAVNFGQGPDSNYQIQGSITKYVSNGAYASVPSENLGFHFGGLRSSNFSRLNYFSNQNGTNKPTTVVNTLLKVDTSTSGQAAWSQSTLPDFITPRVESSMTWVPVGSRGALVVIGGVAGQTFTSLAAIMNSTQKTDLVSQSSNFMTTVPVYDIAGDTWYLQPTTGGPPPLLAQSCVVRATAQDGSSHQIYVYGGYDATGLADASDDVWILSLPSFTWIQASSGSVQHGRYGHVCASPYPDQMMTFGGTARFLAPLKTKAVIDVYNLTSLSWTGKYDPTIYSPSYEVPAAVSAIIGGKSTGGATLQASNVNSSLQSLLSSKYSGKVVNFYPYTPGRVSPYASHPGSSKVVPIVASVVSVVGVIIIGGLVWYFCRPAARKRRSEAQTQSSHSHGRVRQWLGTTPTAEHDNKTVFSDQTTEFGEAFSPPPQMVEVIGDSYFAQKPPRAVAPAAPASEMDTPASPASNPRLNSGATSPQPMLSPGSHTSELEAPRRYAQEMNGGDPSYHPRNHPLYPPSLGHQNSLRSNVPAGARFKNARSPAGSNAMSPSELPPNNSSEHLPKPTDFDLNKDYTAQSTTSGPVSTIDNSISDPSSQSHTDNRTQPSTTMSEGQSEPEIRTATAIPVGSGSNIAGNRDTYTTINTTITSPNTPMNLAGHNRNTSSLSSGISQLTSRARTSEENTTRHVSREVRRSGYQQTTSSNLHTLEDVEGVDYGDSPTLGRLEGQANHQSLSQTLGTSAYEENLRRSKNTNNNNNNQDERFGI